MCTIVQIFYSQINIYKKLTPIWPLLPVQTGSQSLPLKQIISQQPQEVNSQFVHYCTDLLFSNKYLQKGDPNLTFTSCPNRKQKFTIKTNHISTTARGKFTIFTPLYRSLIVKKYLQKSDPNLTFTSCPNRKSKFTIKTNHISTTARGKFTICALLYRSFILKKIFTKRWPQFDLYFLSKPEVKSLLLKQIISQQPQKLNSQFSHLCTDR